MCRRIEKRKDFDPNKRLLFEKNGDVYEFTHKGENFIELSMHLNHEELECFVCLKHECDVEEDA